MTDTLPTTIDEVIAAFDEVLDWAISTCTPLGYFPAVYRGVTCTIRDQVAAGNFDDPDRMIHFDVCFANRYLEAFHGWRAGRDVSKAWAVSFDATKDARLTILQHLLLGVNAHMNLDLGCAASTVAPGPALASLQPDFIRINTILDGLVDHDRLVVDGLSPCLRAIDRIGALSDHLVDFDIERRRQRSWEVAERLALLVGAQHDAGVAEVDARVVAQSRHVVAPGLLISILLDEVKPHEVTDPVVVINALRREPQIDLRDPSPTAEQARPAR